MKFSLVTLYVKDMEKSLGFYHDLLEMPILRRQPFGPGKELVFLGREGDVNLELISADDEVVYSGFSIGFEVSDLALIKERLIANGYAVEREYSPNQALTLCFFKGPNGEEVEFIEHH